MKNDKYELIDLALKETDSRIDQIYKDLKDARTQGLDQLSCIFYSEYKVVVNIHNDLVDIKKDSQIKDRIKKGESQ